MNSCNMANQLNPSVRSRTRYRVSIHVAMCINFDRYAILQLQCNSGYNDIVGCEGMCILHKSTSEHNSLCTHVCSRQNVDFG